MSAPPAARPARTCTTRSLRSDAQINPLSVKQPPNTQLAGAALERFRAEVDRIDDLRADLAHGTQLASRAAGAPAAN